MRSRLSVLFAVLMTAGSLHADPPVMTVGKALPAEGLRAGDQFGSAVAVGDGMIAVGAYLSDAGGRDSGAVYLFHESAGEWKPLDPLKGEAGEQLGFDVAILSENGTHKLLVGAPFAQVGGHRCGAAYLYTLDGDGKQKEGRKVLASPCAEGDEVGSAVALDSTYVVVGARGVEERTGAVYVFAGDGSPRTLTATPRVAKAEFGQSVALHDGRLVVGAPSPYAGSHSPGAAYLFNLPGSSPAALVPSSMPEEGSAFGYAVAIADQIVVGAPLAGGKARPGRVFLFGTDRASSLPEGDKAGVAVAADKGLIVVGAMAAPNGGSAYLCQGGRCRPLTPPPANKVAGFGFGTAIHGETVVVGAFQEKGTGAAYVFEPDPTPTVKVTLSAVTSADVVESAGTVSVKATVSVTGGELKGELSLKIATGSATDSASAGSDYTRLKKSYQVSVPGEKQIEIPILNDGIAEADETFTVTVTAPSGVTVEGSPLTITIKDDDCAKPILPPFLIVHEGGSATFDVSLPRQPEQNVDFRLNFVYDAPSGKPAVGVELEPTTWTIPAAHWEKKQTVELKALNDAACNDSSRAFTLTVTATSADPLFACTQTIPGRVESDADDCVTATAAAEVCADGDGTVLYTFTIENSGSRLEDLAGPELFDTLPDQVRVVAATADLGVATVDYVGNSVAWNGSIPSGATVTVQVLAALEPGANPGTEVKDQDNQFRYGTDGKGPETTFTVGDDICP